MVTTALVRTSVWIGRLAVLAASALSLCGCSAAAGGASSQDAGPDASPFARTSTGCGQGNSCTPASDLAAPTPDEGFQIETPDNGIVVQPGQEVFMCFYRTLPVGMDIDVGAFQSWMTPGSSHHFITYQVGTGNGLLGVLFPKQPDGTLQPCQFGGGTWMYATSTAGEVIEMKMPDNVGLPLAAGTQVMLNMHFINPSPTPSYPKIKMNFLYARNVTYKAAAMVSFNRSINVPPATSGGPGEQTVSGTCTAPVGSHFFAMTTHTHSRGVNTNVNYVTPSGTTNLVHTTDWEHPDVALWSAPNFLTVGQGDSFTYSCGYENHTSMTITVGDTAASNEMCMAIGYYFPASSASCN
jgi:hypothetical protein